MSTQRLDRAKPVNQQLFELVDKLVGDKQQLGDFLHTLAVAMRKKALQVQESVAADSSAPTRSELHITGLAIEDLSRMLKE